MKKKAAKQQSVVSTITADDIRYALSSQHPDGLPPWTIPFIAATGIFEQLEIEDAREEERRRKEEEMRGLVSWKWWCVLDTETSTRHSDSDDELYSDPEEAVKEKPPPGLAYKADPLHAVLRYAENIEYLGIKPDWTHHIYFIHRQDRPMTKTTLLRLKEAVIPPPNFWGIGIIAPNLESLSFAILDDKSRSEAESDARDLTSLIPTIAESPSTIESLVHLNEISFECNLEDSITALEEWLPHLVHVRKFSIRGAPGITLHCDDADRPVKPAHKEILQSLVDHPGWLSKLEQINLTHCAHPDETVVAFVTQRKRREGVQGGLKSVALKRCAPLSDEVYERMKNELEVFSAPSMSSLKG
ncbi:hypothetical protein QFC22_006461 [Naganishia vaughanmartiniae]|uniref:Uncharacterized protein n=1 Tax=Naganishia vaughanmartiniae TaxID=1424756 RepID=A0ACC2WJI2_9TREE|nr:hypothetical protein QFC22_006461 [Naganishia vaughanmartiniae]